MGYSEAFLGASGCCCFHLSLFKNFYRKAAGILRIPNNADGRVRQLNNSWVSLCCCVSHLNWQFWWSLLAEKRFFKKGE